MSLFGTLLLFGVILGLLIFVHELGHFLMAKRAGVRVDEFGFGFPPRLISFRRKETRYSINLIPFGGFVRLFGESGDAAGNPRSFAAQSAWRRAVILLAGVIGNLLLAVVLFATLSQIGTPTIVPDDAVASSHVRDPRVQITAVLPNSPAAAAGILTGDVIVFLGTTPVTRVVDFQTQIGALSGKPTPLTITRGTARLTFTVAPRRSPPPGEGPLGIGLARVALLRAPWYAAPWEGVRMTTLATRQVATAVGQFFGNLFTGHGGAADVVGLVGIAVTTKHVSALGVSFLLQFVALLSINLAIINALPFPGLDGGRLLFLVIEVVRGRRVSSRVEQIVHGIGFAALLALFLVITVSDVSRFGIIERLRNFFS